MLGKPGVYKQSQSYSHRHLMQCRVKCHYAVIDEVAPNSAPYPAVVTVQLGLCLYNGSTGYCTETLAC